MLLRLRDARPAGEGLVRRDEFSAALCDADASRSAAALLQLRAWADEAPGSFGAQAVAYLAPTVARLAGDESCASAASCRAALAELRERGLLLPLRAVGACSAFFSAAELPPTPAGAGGGDAVGGSRHLARALAHHPAYLDALRACEAAVKLAPAADSSRRLSSSTRGSPALSSSCWKLSMMLERCSGVPTSITAATFCSLSASAT